MKHCVYYIYGAYNQILVLKVSPGVKRVLQQSRTLEVAEKWMLSGYTTSAPTVSYSHSWCEVTSVLIERGILVLLQSCTSASAQLISEWAIAFNIDTQG